MNHYLKRDAQKEAYRSVPETCPSVDLAFLELQKFVESLVRSDELSYQFERAKEKVKVQTGLLREAFVEAIEERMKAENELDDATEELKDALSSITDLEAEIERLNTN